MSNLEIIENIKKEAKRILEDCEYSSKGHFESAKHWRYCNYGLMSTSIISVCFSLISVYGGWSTVCSGIIAISSGIVTMLLIFLNPQEKYLSHYNSGNRFLALRNKTRVFLEIESKAMDIEMQMQVVKKLDFKRNDINKYSLPISECAYKNAKEQIEIDKNTQYEADKE
ncbi:TPA: SLATT domain-containing protein [Campylobacter lari]|nr:SLATT domain-containing protein [Campylobacter lari]HEC1782318.1 SLATT domain-containing protein [Campylobacter lari]